MTDLDIDLVFERLAEAVNGAALNKVALQVTATPFAPDVPTVPHWFPAEFDITYERTFGGDCELIITSRLLVSRASPDTGQKEMRLLASAGANTLRTVLLATRNHSTGALAGACDDLFLRRTTGPRLYDYGNDGHYYGLESTIFVMG